MVDDDGVYRNTGPARVFRSERAAIAAIKSRDEDERIRAGDIMVLSCGGPLGTGMEEVYQITAALKHLSYGKNVALITGRAVLRRINWRVHRPRRPGSPGRRADWQGA